MHQRIVADITAAIGEDMLVRDSASEEVRRTRNRCRTIEGRLRSILKGVSGEVSEQVEHAAADTAQILPSGWHHTVVGAEIAIRDNGAWTMSWLKAQILSPICAIAKAYVCHGCKIDR